jgi:Fe-S cluster assembly protein SufD
MNAEVHQIRTAAEAALAETFAAAKTRLPGRGAIAAMRETAFDAFAAKGLPHRRVEEWKYTDLRTLMREAKPLAVPPDKAAKVVAGEAGKLLASVASRRIVVVNGAFVPELSDLTALEPGLSIGSLAVALAQSDAETVRALGRTVALDGDPTVALNTAFMSDGAVIRLADGARLERPIHLVYVASGGTATSIYTRSLVEVGRDAQATIVESHEGQGGVDYQVNHALELSVADGATVEYVKIDAEGDKALHVGTLMAALGAGVTFNAFVYAKGGAAVRNQVALRFDGEGAQAHLRGAILLKGHQHVDTTLIVDHKAGQCMSRELFKSVLDGESRSVFQGKIVVRQNAQKTDGKMMTRALRRVRSTKISNST